MKISLNKLRYAAFAWFLCLLTGCQQDEIMQQSQQRENTATVGSVASRSVTCEVATTEAGTLMAKLDEIASSGGYSKEDITDLTISGPVNREDLRALRPFKNMTKLDMKNMSIVDDWGNIQYDFPDALDSLASPVHVYLPENLTTINWQAFRESNIVAVEMSDNITGIGGYAFSNCKNLHTVKLSNNIEELWYGAFENCTSLTTINTPEKLKNIHGAVFNGCAFSSFTIPESVEFMEWSAFANNPNLETIHWPSKVTTIPSSCFYNCPKLNFEIPNHITRIEDNAFASCTMSTFAIPEDVEYIGYAVFRYNSKLTSINWPAKVTEIPGECFNQCPNLRFEIPDNITKIGRFAFNGSKTITNLTLSSSVKEIGEQAFGSCSNLTSVILPSTLTNVGEYAFANCEKLQSINDISNWTKIPNGIFQNCKVLDIEIPQQTDTIGSWAFNNCDSLSNPKMPATLKFIGNYAFYGTNITELVIPSSTLAVEEYIVAECNKLKVIYWKTTADMPELFYSWNDYGTLIYAKAGINYNSNNKNLIFGDDETGYITESFVINADNDFYCPKAFTAKEVVFRKHFGAWTYTDRPSGWRTIALPFTVTKFVVQATDEQPERELKPFGTEDMGEAKPFWLRTLHSDGFERETTLEAGKPYIIAFPYNPNYYLPEYNISGTVEFWGENVTVIENTQLTPIIGTTYTFQPTFERIKKSMDIYNIDYNSYYDRMYNIHHEGGSLFRSSIRDTEPFESYITNNVTGRAVIPVNGTSASRSTKKLGQIPMEDDM